MQQWLWFGARGGVGAQAHDTLSGGLVELHRRGVLEGATARAPCAVREVSYSPQPCGVRVCAVASCMHRAPVSVANNALHVFGVRAAPTSAWIYGAQ